MTDIDTRFSDFKNMLNDLLNEPDKNSLTNQFTVDTQSLAQEIFLRNFRASMSLNDLFDSLEDPVEDRVRQEMFDLYIFHKYDKMKDTWRQSRKRGGLEELLVEFEPIQADSTFKIHFNNAVIGLQVMKELDIQISTDGIIDKGKPD